MKELAAEIARLARRVRDEPRSTAFVALADALRRGGRPTEAIQALRDGLRVHPDHQGARVVLARIHVDLGNRVLAADVLEDVVRHDAENLAALSLLAHLLIEEGRTADARPLLDRLAIRAPDDPVLRKRGPDAGPLPRTADPFDSPALAARWAAKGHYARALRIWHRIDVAAPGEERVRREIAALERTMTGLGDAPGEAAVTSSEAAEGRSRLPGLQDVLDALADDARDAVPVASLPRYARPFWNVS